MIERVHEAEAHQSNSPLQPAHQFEVTLERDDFTEEKYRVFENYQHMVHGEELWSITRRGFKRFLCDSPIRPATHTGPDGQETKVGSYHQCYRLDGKLVAVGVLDLLPHAVSAVYFMYHESIHKHQPGKLGALREIALAIEGGYRYWYPGYYIHSCPKMRYKIDYSPQYVLDPETMGWDLLDKEALAVFDKKPYVSLSRERALGDSMVGADDGAAAPEHHASLGTDDNGGAEMGAPPGNDGSAEVPTEPEDEVGEDDDDNEDISLFTTDMPGIPTLPDLEQTDLDHIRVLSDHSDALFNTGETVVWQADSIRNLGSLKSKIAELAATVGLDLLDQIVLDFRRESRQRS